MFSVRLRIAMLVIAVVTMGSTACADDVATPTCGPTVHEQLDPSNLHLLPSAAPPTYLTDPPTSGPHISGLRVSGPHSKPLTGIEQVSSLEVGVVIIQHRGLDDGDIGRLADLASETVAVAPAADLPAPIVATGWGLKLSCDGVDVARLRKFVAEALVAAPEPAPDA